MCKHTLIGKIRISSLDTDIKTGVTSIHINHIYMVIKEQFAAVKPQLEMRLCVE